MHISHEYISKLANSVLQSRHQCSSPALTHVTIDVHLSARYSITRGMHFTGRRRWRWGWGFLLHRYV